MRKRCISLISVIICCALLLTSCAQIDAFIGIKSPSGLIELNTQGAKHSNIIGSDIQGDRLAILSLGSEEDGFAYFLSVYDLKWNRLIYHDEIDDCPIKNIWGIKYDDNGELILFNSEERKAAHLDRNYNYLEVVDYIGDSEKNDEEKRSSNSFITDDMELYDSFARLYRISPLGVGFEKICFYDEGDCFYLADTRREKIIAANGSQALCIQLNEDYSHKVKLAVYDYKAHKLVNETSLGSNDDETFPNASEAAMSDKYVVISVFFSTSNGAITNKLYYWNYNKRAVNKPFEMERVDEQSLAQKNDKLTRDIFRDFSVRVYYGYTIKDAPAYSSLKNKLGTDGDAMMKSSAFDIFYVQQQLYSCFKLLPYGFIRELCSDYPSGDETGWKGLEVYIYGSERDERTIVYSSQNDADCYLALSSDYFEPSNIPHGLMHLMEYRINDYYSSKGESFSSIWSKLNPSDFVYSSDSDSSRYDNYFISYHSRTSQTEDMADLFTSLFEASPLDEIMALDGNLPIYQKTVTLCKAIRLSFPSTKGAERLPWEHENTPKK